jgi:hypothetical protein
MELVFKPRNQWEVYASKFMRTIHPYLAYFTYKYHVERAREGGKNAELIN